MKDIKFQKDSMNISKQHVTRYFYHYYLAPGMQETRELLTEWGLYYKSNSVEQEVQEYWVSSKQF